MVSLFAGKALGQLSYCPSRFEVSVRRVKKAGYFVTHNIPFWGKREMNINMDENSTLMELLNGEGEGYESNPSTSRVYYFDVGKR